MRIQNLNARHLREIGQSIRNHHYERMASGLLFPRQGLHIGGVFEHDVNGEDHRVSPNLMTNQGLDHILDVLFKSATATEYDPWYVFLYDDAVSAAATWTGANIHTTHDEVTDYDETTRPAFVDGTISSQSLNNSASKAVFTMSATVTVGGAGLVSSSTKGTAAAILLCAADFSPARDVVDNDILNVQYTISASDA